MLLPRCPLAEDCVCSFAVEACNWVTASTTRGGVLLLSDTYLISTSHMVLPVSWRLRL
ncbi:protein of unknown function [Hyphomicrobium sp. MC1]|nr:protein of unknown function [Hyphomicrobium sp. MC1]